ESAAHRPSAALDPAGGGAVPFGVAAGQGDPGQSAICQQGGVGADRQAGLMQGEAESRPRSASMVWLLLGAGLALSLLLVLGTWQVQRLAWKENLIATIEARLADAPRPLEEI